MQSHWEKLENIRVVDAGYLLAGMEPERKWQFAPPLVANFFNLIRDKTGAVKLATLPGERMEITRAEFQALKAEYGVTPATEPTNAPESNEAERLAERELFAAFSETVNNGAALNWRYWVHQLPTLTTAEAARLMCGLDPDLFKSLESRPNKNDQRQLCAKAAMIQRLAEREGKESTTPSEWITWAGVHQIAVHDGFRLEVESAPAKTTATPAPVAVVALMESDKAGPQPVPTSAMAASFSGLRWDGEGWLTTLGNKPKWLDACLVLGGGRGEGMRKWNPVLIGAHLVNAGHVKANNVRAKFQTKDALKPWLDEWKTYEADKFPAD